MKRWLITLFITIVTVAAGWQILQPAAVANRLQATPRVPVVKRQPPQRDGSIVHTVQQGDTLSTIAFAYGVDINQIRQLNNLSANSNNIIIGQKLLIRPAAQATTAPTEDTASAVAPTITPTPTEIPVTPTLPPIGNKVSLCVKAFNDANQNHWDDTGEQALAGTKIKLAQPAGAEATAEAPICFNNLPNGIFLISAVPPDKYSLTTPPQLRVEIKAGQRINVAFGAAQGYKDGQAALVATEAAPPKQTVPSTTVGDLIGQNSGLIVLAVAGFLFVAGMSVAFLARRL